MSGYQIPHFGLQRQYKNLKKELLDATHNALSSGQLVGGHYTRAFEEWLKHKTKAWYVVTVHSGTQALEIIARYTLFNHCNAYSVNGATIRLPNITYPATLNAFLTTGWDVELSDTDRNGLMPVQDTDKAEGVFECLVGLYGAKPYETRFGPDTYYSIVDGAQHWLVADENFGLGMAVSFDPTKNLPSSGNGGAILTHSESLYKFALNYRDNGKPTTFTEPGTNSKMSEQDCAQILVRAKYIDEWQTRRERIARYWCDRFCDLPLKCLTDGFERHAHQKFVMYLPDRNSLHTELLTSGIESNIHYRHALSELPLSKDLVKPDMVSTSVMLTRGVISLPIYPELTDEEVDRIADTVEGFYKDK